MPARDIEKRRATARAYYQRPDVKARYRAKNIAYAEEIRSYIKNLKNTTPCKDCSVNYPYYVMDFDHKENKRFNISKMAMLKSMKLVLIEIAKCDIVCSNCHRIRTFGRLTGEELATLAKR